MSGCRHALLIVYSNSVPQKESRSNRCSDRLWASEPVWEPVFLRCNCASDRLLPVYSVQILNGFSRALKAYMPLYLRILHLGNLPSEILIYGYCCFFRKLWITMTSLNSLIIFFSFFFRLAVRSRSPQKIFRH